MNFPQIILIATVLIWLSDGGLAQRKMERLGRGLVVVPSGEKDLLASWRLLGSDPEPVGFNLYRRADDARVSRINDQPITGATNFLVNGGSASPDATFFVRPLVEGKELAASAEVPVWAGGFLEIPIKLLDGYRAGDASIGDLDGRLPSLVMCRGVYGRTVLAAWDWRGGELTQRWVFDSGSSAPPFKGASEYSGMGGHSLGVADVDGDGRDEIVYQAMVIDDDGKGLHTSGLRHGDAMHVSDLDPLRPGQEIYTVQENEGSEYDRTTPGAAMRDANTGELLWSHSMGIDVGAGLSADIDPRHPGCECWGGPGGLRSAKGERIGRAPRSSGFAVWWDGDLLRELLSGSRVTKWDWETAAETTVMNFPAGGKGSRYPCLTGDLIGDWREEVMLPGPDGRSLRLYTTPLLTKHRLTTLMHDSQYRLGIAWQNVVYNKPPHPSFFLGDGMKQPPRVEITTE